MADDGGSNPFFQMDQPQVRQPVQPAPVQAPNPVQTSPDDQNNPFFSMKDPPAPHAAPPPVAPSDDDGYFAPERKVWGMMQSDPMGTVKKLGSAALAMPYNAVTNAVSGIKPTIQQMGADTASNTADPETAGRSAQAAGMMTSGDMMAPGLSGKVLKGAVDTPTAQELKLSGGQGYKEAFGAGVHFWPQGVSDLAGSIKAQLEADHFYDVNAPQTHGVLDQMQGIDQRQSVPLSQVYAYRERLRELAKSPGMAGTKDGAATESAIRGLDQFMENPPAPSVLSGPAPEAGAVLREARGDYSAAKRSDKLQGIEYNAEVQSANPRGSTYDSSLRRKVQPLLNPQYPNRLSGFAADEQAGIQNIADPTGVSGAVRNGLGTAGEWLGGKGHFASPAAAIGSGIAGAYQFGPMGAALAVAPPLAGAVLRAGENALTKRAFNKVDTAVRQRSPLYQNRLANAPETMSQAPQNVLRGADAVIPQTYAEPETGHPFYAKGGSVKRPTHEFLVNRLMKLAEKAKREEKKITAPILNMPDDTVTAALAKAQEAI